MATATAITGATMGAAKFFEGRKMQRKAENFIKNFEFQKLQNPYESAQVSTLGADIQSKEAARTTATSVDALRGGGTRALVGGLGRVQQQNNTVNQNIGANLDQQQKQLTYAEAGQDINNQNTMEQRQSNELAGYGQMMNVGMGMKFQGMDNLVNAAGMFSQTGIGQGVEDGLSAQTTTPQYNSTPSIIGGVPTMTQGNASTYSGNYHTT